MKIKLITQLSLIAMAMLIGLQSCGDDGNDPNPAGKGELAKTERGTPNGDAISKSIGASGGELTSNDGSLTVTIPAGALSSNTTVSIQSITNLSPLSVGSAYRLSPEGTTFAKPATIKFNYTASQLGDNTIEDFLWITTQDKDGVWNGMLRSYVDKDKNTVAVETTHFSDWSMGRFLNLTLIPTSLALPVGKQLILGVIGFATPEEVAENPDIVPLVFAGGDGEDDLTGIAPIPPIESRMMSFRVKQWTLNGTTAPVSNAKGSLSPSGMSALYKAPATKPTPNVVAVTAELETTHKDGKKSAYYLTSNITIVDSEYYLHLQMNGADYTYYQYGFNGQVPPGDKFDMVNCGRDGDGNIGISAGSYNASVITNIFLADFLSPGVGSRKISCFNDENIDAITFTSAAGSMPFADFYTKRTKKNNDCDSDDLCAEITVNLTTYSPNASSDIEGTMSGVLYQDSEANEKDCKTPEPVPFKVDFKLIVVN